MIWMWGPTSPIIIFFFTLALSWHPGSCFSRRAPFQMCLTLLLPDTNLGHTKRVNDLHNQIKVKVKVNFNVKFDIHARHTASIKLLSQASPCDIFWWSFSGNFVQTQIKMWLLMTLTPWNIWWLTQSSSKSQYDLLLQCISPRYYSFDWSRGPQNLAASVKWTVIKLFKNGTAGEIIIQNDPRLLEIIAHLVW